MAEGDERLRTVLDAYANFLCEKKLAVPKHQSYLVRRVHEFLLFARQHGGYTFEQTLDLFLADVGRRVGVKPWQIQQAADAMHGLSGPAGPPHGGSGEPPIARAETSTAPRNVRRDGPGSSDPWPSG